MKAHKHLTAKKLAVVGALLLTLVLATVALADSVTGTATITGGTFGYSAVDNPAFGSVVLSDANETLTDDIVVGVDDPTGSGNGWKLDIAADPFSDGLGHSLSADALSVTAVTASTTSESSVMPTNNVSYAVTVGGTATDFFNAAVNTGMGSFDLTTSLGLSVPATTFAGTYTSTVTITATQGPS